MQSATRLPSFGGKAPLTNLKHILVQLYNDIIAKSYYIKTELTNLSTLYLYHGLRVTGHQISVGYL